MSYFSAALSCEQRPFFLVARLLSEILLSFVIVKSDRLNKSKVESGKKRIIKILGYLLPTGINKRLRYIFAMSRGRASINQTFFAGEE